MLTKVDVISVSRYTKTKLLNLVHDSSESGVEERENVVVACDDNGKKKTYEKNFSQVLWYHHSLHEEQS